MSLITPSTSEEKRGILARQIADLKNKFPGVSLDRGNALPDTNKHVAHLLINNKDQIHTTHLLDQVKKANHAIAEKKVERSSHHFDHTIRNGHLFETNHASIRYQLGFSPLGSDIPFILPLSDEPNDETAAVHASVFDWQKIPHELIICFLTSTFNTKHKAIPSTYLLPHAHTQLEIFLMQNPLYMQEFKGYLAAGKSLTYTHSGLRPENDIPKSENKVTPRVISLPDGKILLIQHNDQIYSEKHLRAYTGTRFFFRVFSSIQAYRLAEQKTLHQIEIQTSRFTELLKWFDSELREDTSMEGFLSQELQHTRQRFNSTLQEFYDIFSFQKTVTDQQLAKIIENMLKSKHIGHIRERRQKARILLQDRFLANEKMSETIRKQSAHL